MITEQDIILGKARVTITQDMPFLQIYRGAEFPVVAAKNLMGGLMQSTMMDQIEYAISLNGKTVWLPKGCAKIAK